MTNSQFPENQIEILHEYMPDVDTTLIEGLRQGLSNAAINVTGIVVGPDADLVNQIRSQRAALLQFLNHSAFDDARLALIGILDDFKQREFGRAKTKVDGLARLPSVLRVFSFGNALRTTPVAFREQFESGNGGGTFSIPRTLPGYQGPTPTEQQRAQILTFSSFLSKDDERRFRERLLRAEAHAGLRSFEDALEEYDLLLGDTESLTQAQVRFVAIRAGFAHLALGDFLFRRAFKFSSESDRDEVRNEYVAARDLMNTHGFSPGNPIAKRILDYASQQEAKLNGGFTFLGYRDSYVPPRRLDTLAGLADGQIKVAKDASEKFNLFKSNAEQLVRQLAELNQDQLEAELGVEIAQKRVDNAGDKAEAAKEQKRLLEDKLDSLEGQLAAGLTRSVFATMAFGPGSVTEVGGELDGPGVLNQFTGYFGSRNELRHQKRIAEIEEGIARRDQEIAGLEMRIADSRLAFVEDCIDAVINGAFNADRFIGLANAYEDMTRRHVDSAFEFLYLLERAINFRRLKSVTEVQGNVTQLDPLLAPAELSGLLETLKAAALADGPGQNSFPLPPSSLKLRYPIEFERFRQEGKTEFVISLYDVEKLMNFKGNSNVRVKKIGVEVIGGVSPATGWTGSLTHRGTTMFRDKDSVLLLEPGEGRFVPTDTELEQALLDLQSGKKDTAAVGTVKLFPLDQNALRISSVGDVPLTEQEPDFELAPIENYGLPGSWVLDIEGLNLALVADVRLHFVVSVDHLDEGLKERVEQLIRAYENELAGGKALDRIRAYSLQQRFPNTFDQLGQTGQGTFAISEEDFPADSKVQTVVMQALDEDNKGIEGTEIELSKPGTSFTLSRTTVEMGFSEDIDAEIPPVPEADRPPTQGTWQIRLPKPEQFTQLAGLNLFFVYEHPGV
jgi:hypothetical protein